MKRLCFFLNCIFFFIKFFKVIFEKKFVQIKLYKPKNKCPLPKQKKKNKPNLG